MSVRINQQKKTVTALGVRDVLEESTSPLGTTSGVSVFARRSLGREAHTDHQQAQADLMSGYKREVAVKYQTHVDDYTVTVQGRIDGVYERNGLTVVEEIKSVVKTKQHFEALSADSFPNYVTQLRLYCFFVSREKGANVTGHLVFSNVVDGAKKQMEIAAPFDDIETLITNRVRMLLQMARLEEQRTAAKREISAVIEFPFSSPRPHQDEMIQAAQRALHEGRHLMVCAPSGIGKTAGALYPALKYALASGKRVFFVTAKNTQQDLAWETLRKMQREDRPFAALRLRAKEQMCINDVYACYEELCPNLRQMREKLESLDVPNRLQQKPMSDPEWLMDVGRTVSLCPFDLALMRSGQADVIVCDYNYVFDPAVYLRHFFQEGDHGDCVLIIDEAHNLYSRAMDYYSPSLRRADIRACLQALPSDPALERDLAAWLKSLDRFFVSVHADGKEKFGEEKKFPIALPQEFFGKKREEAERLSMRYFLYHVDHKRVETEDPLNDFFAQFFQFVNALDLAGMDEPQIEDEFSFLFDGTESHRLKILCKDPSRLLAKRIECFHSVIAMSATMEPMEFYRDVLGFDAKRTDFISLASPFPRENRKILVVPALSTTYRARGASYEKLAGIIAGVVAQHHGNYAAFFPSYEYLRNTEPFLRPLLESRLPDSELIVQESSMTKSARDEMLAQLRESSRGKVMLAVQGGIFSEGVDFEGDTLIGVIVISPALPTFDFERELLRAYYDQRCGKGFEYAYLYPGMTRVIQSVGRLIRTETDRGVAVLICNRFAQRQYSSLFPRDWYEHEPEELIVRNIGPELDKFWGAVGLKEDVKDAF